MARVVYSDTAQTDLAAAISFIHEYFESRELIELGERHVITFKAEMWAKEKLLQEAPQLYAVRQDGYFKNATRKFRSYLVHWFTVFYSYEEDEDEVVIWYIRSSKSDYSNIVYLDQSRTTE
jgi:plasmid stabilization system protein ParE